MPEMSTDIRVEPIRIPLGAQCENTKGSKGKISLKNFATVAAFARFQITAAFLARLSILWARLTLVSIQLSLVLAPRAPDLVRLTVNMARLAVDLEYLAVVMARLSIVLACLARDLERLSVVMACRARVLSLLPVVRASSEAA